MAIYGTDKNDIITGTDGVDKIYAREGDDVIYGKDGDDHLYGSAGNDTIHSAAGADIIGGGDGNDTASYETSEKEVFITLDNSPYEGDHVGDVFYSIENVIGSQYHDTIYGDGKDNIFWSNGGSDRLHGYSYQYEQDRDISYLFNSGNDVFYTQDSTENDSPDINIGFGSNTVYGGAGNEHIHHDPFLNYRGVILK